MKPGKKIALSVITAILTTILIIAFYYATTNDWRMWSGFVELQQKEGVIPHKTLWDWMDLLIIPLALAFGAWLLKRADSKLERDIAEGRIREAIEIEESRAQESVLETYFDRMSELLLKEKLIEKSIDNPAMNLARIRTLTTLKRLNGIRRNYLLGFLRDASLLTKENNCKPLLATADIKNFNLMDAELSFANLRGASLGGSNLSRADLREADLGGADLNKVNLKKAILINANLSGANLRGADLSEANLYGVDLRGSDMGEAKLDQTKLGEANLHKANLSETNLRLAYLTKAIISDANLSDANLSWSNLGRADMSGSDLRRANLGGANLQEANLRNANLTGAYLRDAELREVKLQGVNLSESNLNGANVTAKQLKEAMTLKGAKLDDKLKQQLIEDGVEI